MAKGFERHRAHQDALNALGRHLARRSGSRCELCETSGVPLAPYEVPPPPDEPELDRTLFLCEPCSAETEVSRFADPRRWRVLENTVWSEVPAVQVTAVRIVRRLAATGEDWAQQLLENLYLAPEVESWLEEA